MNILIVGAGTQGIPCAAILARHRGVDRILLGSRRLASAETARDRIGSPKIVAAELDAGQADAVAKKAAEVLGSCHVVVDLTPAAFAQSVMRTAIALGAHYVNAAACDEHLMQLIEHKPLDLADQFVAAGRTALVGCGATTGVSNVVCRRFCDKLDTVERIEIRFAAHTPAQRARIKTWSPQWSPGDSFLDYWSLPCVFEGGRHRHVPQFHEPETYSFGGNLGQVELSHHFHEEPFCLPINIGKGIQYCCFKFPIEPAVATFIAAGFAPDRFVEVQGVKVNSLEVLVNLQPPPAQTAVLERKVQAAMAPLIADTRAHILIKGTAGGEEKTFRISTGLYFDQAVKALDLFGIANIAVAYGAAAGALNVAEGHVKPGIVWPEELDPVRFFELANTLGLELKVSTSGITAADLRAGVEVKER